MHPKGASFEYMSKDVKSSEELKDNLMLKMYKHMIETEDFSLYMKYLIKPCKKYPAPLDNKEYYKRWFYSLLT